MRINPPTMRSLMDDAVYRAYMRKVPPHHPANTHGDPWQLWLRTSEGRWKTGRYPGYRDVWPTFTTALRSPQAADVCIVSRRVWYAPPGKYEKYRARVTDRKTQTTSIVERTRWVTTFAWDASLSWCGRCRRPSHWMPLFSDHHALKRQPAVTTLDNLRCVYCGVRWIAQPELSEMERIIPREE